MPRSKKPNGSTGSAQGERYLQQIANCLAYLVINTGELKEKSKGDLMQILASFGFDRTAIASLLETTPESVSARLSQIKAESKVRKVARATVAGLMSSPERSAE